MRSSDPPAPIDVPAVEPADGPTSKRPRAKAQHAKKSSARPGNRLAHNQIPPQTESAVPAAPTSGPKSAPEIKVLGFRARRKPPVPGDIIDAPNGESKEPEWILTAATDRSSEPVGSNPRSDSVPHAAAEANVETRSQPHRYQPTQDRRTSILIVTNNAEDWPAKIEGVEVVDDEAYLTDPRYCELRGAKVFNLCRSYRYQSAGYYVSLLAEARGHKPLPSVATVRDFKTQSVVRMVSDEFDELIQRGLAPIKSPTFRLSIYFGQNLAAKYKRLALALFNQFQSPLLRAEFSRDAKGRWQLRKVDSISGNEVPKSHWGFVAQAASEHFVSRRGATRKKFQPRYDLAILHRPDDPTPPSNPKALQKFIRAAESMGLAAELITKDDFGRIAQFDGLFIRDTTFISNYTYRFARKAEVEGLVVVDDPSSILRCTNKVYLAELLARHHVLIPQTVVAHAGNASRLGERLGFPLVLKKPDSAFSHGVVKVGNADELAASLETFLRQSDLVVAQEFLPTTFDWRIGVLDRQPIFACKYYMAAGHWQIINHAAEQPRRYGRSETMPIDWAPRKAVQAAVKAANLIGDGLYGVDIKESEGKFYVMEVNDNPNLDAGVEDQVLKDELYRRIMGFFLRRIERQKSRHF